jgi:hypothetical protein
MGREIERREQSNYLRRELSNFLGRLQEKSYYLGRVLTGKRVIT